MAANRMTATEAKSGVELRYRVEGMDCTSCALKIEGAVEKLGGADEIEVNYKTQVLGLRLDETVTPRATVEDHIRQLGYGVTPLA